MALGEALTKAKPGGSIRPLWEPDMTTSQNHSSVFISWTARPDTASTTKTALEWWTTAPMALTSGVTPVDVSANVMNTALVSGWASSKDLISAAVGTLPH